MADAVRFFESTSSSTQIASFEVPTKARVLAIDDSPYFVPQPPIPIDDLYSEPLATRPELGHALRGLASAKQATREALEALKRGESVASDDSMQRLQALLPELFCCRSLGDGFGAIINALNFCFENAAGGPFSEPQIAAMEQVVERLRDEPFLGFGAAVEAITRLEDTGLNVDPPAFASLTDLWDVEGLR